MVYNYLRSPKVTLVCYKQKKPSCQNLAGGARHNDAQNVDSTNPQLRNLQQTESQQLDKSQNTPNSKVLRSYNETPTMIHVRSKGTN